jgi:hypothetical protein
MWDLAVREEDYSAVDAMLSRFSRAPLSMRLLPAFARGDSAARLRFIEEATNSDNRQSQIGARYVATFLEDFTTAESIARLDLAERRRPPIRLGAQIFLARAWPLVGGKSGVRERESGGRCEWDRDRARDRCNSAVPRSPPRRPR